MPLEKPHAKYLRKGRHSQVGYYYFLTTSVAGRRRIFDVPSSAVMILEAIRWLHDTHKFSVDAAVVMPDHLHMAGQLHQSSLSNLMHSLKSYTAKRLIGAGVKAPVWQKGYYDHALRDNEDYRVKVRYLIDNPIRAELVGRIEDYPYLILPSWWYE